MACGGGSGIHFWYIPLLQYCSYIPIPNIQSLLYVGDDIISGGNGTIHESQLNIWTQDGKLKSQIKTSNPSIYSIAKQQNNEVIATCGVADRINIYSSTQFIHFHQIFSLQT